MLCKIVNTTVVINVPIYKLTSHECTAAVPQLCVNCTSFYRIMFAITLVLIIVKIEACNFYCNTLTTEQQTNIKFLVWLRFLTKALKFLWNVRIRSLQK